MMAKKKSAKSKISASLETTSNNQNGEDNNTQPRNYFKELFDALTPDNDIKDNSKEIIHACVEETLNNTVRESKIDYNIIIQYDSGILIRNDADKIYASVKKTKNDKNILLILYSSGGDVSSAYLIGKLCQEYKKDKFVAVVPRHAKSAVTLICCGANEIHMGSLSELGPIDPQINKMPALGLKDAVRQIAELSEELPKSSGMLAEYLHKSVEPIHIGYYNRVVESAAQYAERLLNSRGITSGKSSKIIANHLVYTYKDHAFVIDKNEAMDIFGSEVIKTGTSEYILGDTIYSLLSRINYMCDYFNKGFYYIGNSEDAVGIYDRNKSNIRKNICRLSKK